MGRARSRGSGRFRLIVAAALLVAVVTASAVLPVLPPLMPGLVVMAPVAVGAPS